MLRTADAESIDRLLAAGRGHLRQVTLAPELPGAPGAIRTLMSAGVAVAVGHSSADYDTALAAFDAGGAGDGDGDYLLGTPAVTVTDGVARLSDGTGNGAIAGSTLTLDAALRRAVTEVGIPIEEAVTALTETPARAVGRSRDLGLLAVGYAADAVLLRDAFTVDEVFASGRRLPA